MTVRVWKDADMILLDIPQYRDQSLFTPTLMPVRPRGVPRAFMSDRKTGLPALCNRIGDPLTNDGDFRTAGIAMLGKGQKQWLEEKLLESTTMFKLILSSVTV